MVEYIICSPRRPTKLSSISSLLPYQNNKQLLHTGSSANLCIYCSQISTISQKPTYSYKMPSSLDQLKSTGTVSELPRPNPSYPEVVAKLFGATQRVC
jgi:hypothetical protein